MQGYTHQFKGIAANSIWTKHGFPTERVDKLMGNCWAVFHELNHTNPPFDHIPSHQENGLDCVRKNNNRLFK